MIAIEGARVDRHRATTLNEGAVTSNVAAALHVQEGEIARKDEQSVRLVAIEEAVVDAHRAGCIINVGTIANCVTVGGHVREREVNIRAPQILDEGANTSIAAGVHFRERDCTIRQDMQAIAARVTIESARVDADISAASRVVNGDTPSRVAAAGHIRERDVPAISNGDTITSIAVGVHTREVASPFDEMFSPY